MEPEIARRGVCLVVAAPSGAGKSTITRALLAAEPRLSLSVSATTRPMPLPARQGSGFLGTGKSKDSRHAQG